MIPNGSVRRLPRTTASATIYVAIAETLDAEHNTLTTTKED
jgi:hypothetical protein